MKKLLWATAITGLILTGEAKAQIVGFTPPLLNPYSVDFPGGGEPTGNDGELFTPTTNITVTALGYVKPGTTTGNSVGLYAVATSTLLASSTITSSSPIASGDFLFNSLATPVTLTAGVQYEVVGFYSSDGPSGVTADSGVGAGADITFDGYAYDYSSSLDLPTNSYSPAEFGPNFIYSVPEPYTVALALTSCGLLICFRLRQVIKNEAAAKDRPSSPSV